MCRNTGSHADEGGQQCHPDDGVPARGLSHATWRHVRVPVAMAVVVVVTVLAGTSAPARQTSGHVFPPSLASARRVVDHDHAHNVTDTGTSGLNNSDWKSCVDLTFAPPNAFALTALASFPGSGNTWTRHLIQQLTGYFTGSVYNDDVLRENGFPGEYVQDGRVIAIKTHHIKGRVRHGYRKCVIVMRSPYAAIIAEYNREMKGHVGTVDAHNFTSKVWREFADEVIGGWLAWHRFWLAYPADKLVLQYEDMRADLRPALADLCAFLGVPRACAVPGRVDCVLRNSDGNFRREARAGRDLDPFTTAQRMRVERTKRMVYKRLNHCIDKRRCTGRPVGAPVRACVLLTNTTSWTGCKRAV